MSWKEKFKETFFKEMKTAKFLGFLAFLSILFLGVVFVMTTKIESSGSIECDTGFIGLNIDTHIEEVNKSFTLVKGSYIDKKTRLDNFSIKNIDGLKCKGSFSVKAPIILLGGF